MTVEDASKLAQTYFQHDFDAEKARIGRMNRTTALLAASRQMQGTVENPYTIDGQARDTINLAKKYEYFLQTGEMPAEKPSKKGKKEDETQS